MSEQIDTTENLYAQVRNLTRERNFLRMQLAGIAAERHHSGVEELAYQLRQERARAQALFDEITLLRRQLRLAEKEIPATALEIPLALKLEYLQRHHKRHAEQARIAKGVLRGRVRKLERRVRQLEAEIDDLRNPRVATSEGRPGPEHQAHVPHAKAWVPLLDERLEDDPAEYIHPDERLPEWWEPKDGVL